MGEVMQKGIIVSIQGLTRPTTAELAKEAINAGAVALRLDKHISGVYTIIGLAKVRKIKRQVTPFITPTVEHVKQVENWANYIAVDFRTINPELQNISDYCQENKLDIIADIGTIEDYENILKNNYYYKYIATTLTVLYNYKRPDLEIIKKIKKLKGNEKIIAEGNFKYQKDVARAFEYGADNVCIGNAITNVYVLTRSFTRLVK
jgi:putative N-acetylmannosamine-6-phosphate epimerase